MIAIVNYGLGNVLAIANIYKRLGIAAEIVDSPQQLSGAEKIILPGVGAFDWAMTRLNDSGMRDQIEELVSGQHRPVLGICVGMQMMAASSEEGKLPGFGWFDAEVRRFDESSFTSKTLLPHMGWNDVMPRQTGSLFRSLDERSRFYFLHSYYFAPRSDADVLADTDYNGPFASSVQRGNLFGVQFHPEKSHRWGIQLLHNFAEL
jgi:glutamine amidotransferase